MDNGDCLLAWLVSIARCPGNISKIKQSYDLTMSQTAQSEIEVHDDVNSEVASKIPTQWTEKISVPRWAVYTQAALLGLIATTFFIFGLMVGSLTSGTTEINKTFGCRVIGSVAYRIDGDLHADDGAVVFLLPKNEKPDQRGAGELVNPDTFKPLDNPAIDRIHELGGAVVRADENGAFEVVVDANYGNGIQYYLLIVSKNKRGVDTGAMTKEQVAGIGTYFAPIEDVVQDRSLYWMTVVAAEERIDLPEIEF